MIKKIAGWGILAIFFLCYFAALAYIHGVIPALIIFVAGILIAGLIALAVFWIVY